MKNFVCTATAMLDNLIAELNSQAIVPNDKPPLNIQLSAVKIVHKYVLLLRSKMEKHLAEGTTLFNTAKEEQQFFKKIKPSIHSLLYYHMTIYDLLSKWPHGSLRPQQLFLENEIQKLNDYFQEHRELYVYFKNGNTGLDEVFFMRGNWEKKLEMGFCIISSDENFSTGYDEKFAVFMANEKLLSFLAMELERLSRPPSTSPNLTIAKSDINWTGSKTSLVELIYALHYSGALNNGKAPLKNIAFVFEKIFGIQLGDYYRTYVEIRMRKKGYTPFLDEMKTVLTKKIDDSI